MIRKFTLLLILSLGLSPLFSQLPDGSIGPDFTVVDLDGNQYNLYSMLAEGKAVVMDLSAAWCQPCWNFHLTGALETAWDLYGPDGTDEMMVMLIESEATNTQQQLFGVTTSQDRAGFTTGNWVEVTPFPIADDASVAGSYNLSFYPTIFLIRPDMRTSQIYDDLYWLLLSFNPATVVAGAEYLNYLATNDEPNDVALRLSRDRGFDLLNTNFICESVNQRIDFTNMGTTNLTSVQIDAIMDGNVVSTKTWTGEIPPLGSSFTVLPEITLEDDNFISYALSLPNGVADPVNILQGIDSVFYSVLKTTNTLSFAMRTDFWPEEIGFQLRDPDGQVVFSDANFGTLSCDALYTMDIPITKDGCYTLELDDTFGDGLLNGPITPGQHSCGTPNGQANMAMGEIAIVNNLGDTLFNNISYGSGANFELKGVMPSAVNELDAFNSLVLYPNPASDEITVDFSLQHSEVLRIDVLNSLGQIVETIEPTTYENGENSVNINTSDYKNGMYILSFNNQDGVKTSRFSVYK